MGCGDRYRHLAVTSNGYTMDNPFGLVGLYPYDYIQWRDLARKLVETATEHFKALGDYEDSIGVAAKWNELIPLQNGMIEDYEALPDIWFTGATGEAGIGQAQEVVAQALCLMEQADDALVAYKQKPPIIPGVLPKPRPGRDDSSIPWWVWGVGAGVTAMAVTLIFASAKANRGAPRKEPPPKPALKPRPGQVVARRPEGATA